MRALLRRIFAPFHRPSRGTRDTPLTTDDRAELAQKLAWRRTADEEGRFLNVFIEQNNTCNLRCTMCGFSDVRANSVPRYSMPRKLFDTIASEVFPRTTYLHMSLMTEPFMTSDFGDRLHAVRTHAVPYCRVVTNGTLLTDRTIEQVLDSEVTSLTISIDGGTRELYEAIRHGSSFEKVLRNIDRFKQRRAKRRAALPRLQINHVLMEQNIDHVDAFLDLLDRIQPEQVDVRTIEQWGFSSGNEARRQSFYDKVRKVRPLFLSHFASRGIEDWGWIRDEEGTIELPGPSGGRLTCRRPWDTLAIHANGDVQPCMSWTRPPFGNLARESFEQIWNGDEIQLLRREFTRVQPGVDCQHCTIKKRVAADVYDDFFLRLISKPAERFGR